VERDPHVRDAILLYPFAIGSAYLIPLDLAFSCWFSYLFARPTSSSVGATGLDGPSAGQGWPFLKEISAGAWIGVTAMILWANHKYLAYAFDRALGSKSSAKGTFQTDDDPVEDRRYRIAFLGLLIGGVFLLVWSHFLGIAVWASLAFFGIFFALSLAITRVRAEFGTPHEIVFVKPADIMVTLLGTRAIGDSSLIGMQSMYWFNRGYRCHPMPNFLEGFKMAEGRRMPFAPLIGVFALAAVASLVTTFAANYFVTYQAGGQAKAAGYKWWVGQEAFAQLAGWLQSGQRPAQQSLGFFLGGLVIVGAPDLHAAGVPLVAASPDRICPRSFVCDELLLVLCLRGMAGETLHHPLRRNGGAQTGGAVLPRPGTR
jgi:hypothetical protein